MKIVCSQEVMNALMVALSRSIVCPFICNDIKCNSCVARCIQWETEDTSTITITCSPLEKQTLINCVFESKWREIMTHGCLDCEECIESRINWEIEDEGSV